MIIELLIGAGAVAAGAALTRYIVRRRRAKGAEGAEGEPEEGTEEPTGAAKDREQDEEPGGEPSDEQGDEQGDEPGGDQRKKAGARAKPERDGPRGLLVGDVLLYADTELWLAGMIELWEEDLVMRLFPTPGSLRSTWAAQLDPNARELATLRECDEVPEGSIPERLPIGGRRLSLERRGHAQVRTEGEQLPDTRAEARYVMLSDVGGRTLIVLDFEDGSGPGPRLSLVGDRLSASMVDHLPGAEEEDEGE